MELFGTLRALAAEGCSVVFISHKLYEVMEIADRVLVLSKGSVVAERATRDTNERELANLMVGRELAVRRHTGSQRRGDPALEIRSLSVKNDKGAGGRERALPRNMFREILGMAGVSATDSGSLRKPSSASASPTAETCSSAGNRFLPENRGRGGQEDGPYPGGQDDHGAAARTHRGGDLVLENHASFRSFGMLDHAAIGSMRTG